MSELEAPSRRQLTPDEYLSILRRRIWWLIVPALLGPVIGYGVALKLPARYTSQTLVLVEEQKVPDTFVKPVVTEVLDERLATMQEQILSRTRLQPIIERFALFSDQSKLSLDEKIDLMRKATEITPVKPDFGNPRAALQGFYVSFTSSDPRLAQQVCGELTSMFMEENLRSREQRAQGTTTFIGGQLEDAKRNLDEQDSKLADFKKKYLGQLPSEDQTNFSMMQSLNSQLDATTQALSQLQQSRTYTEAMLGTQLQAWQNLQGSTGAGVANPDSMEQQLSKDQTELSDLLSKYTETYPDVVRLKHDIEQLKAKMQEAGKAPKPAVKEQRIGTEPAQVQQLRAQLASLQLAIRDKEKQQARIQQQIQVYQSRIQLSPVVEEQYKQLTRDHETALEFYNELLKKRNQSEMATDLERQQEGEQFHVLDPPNLPERPTFPKRPLFAAGGMGGGLAIGVILVFLPAFIKKQVRNEKDVLFYLQLPTLTTLPDLEAKRGKAASRKSQNGTQRHRIAESA